MLAFLHVSVKKFWTGAFFFSN